MLPVAGQNSSTQPHEFRFNSLFPFPTSNETRIPASGFISSIRRPIRLNLVVVKDIFWLFVLHQSLKISLVYKHLIKCNPNKIDITYLVRHLFPHNWESRSDFNLVSVADLNTYDSLLSNSSQERFKNLQLFGTWMDLLASKEDTVPLLHFAWDAELICKSNIWPVDPKLYLTDSIKKITSTF